jgi:hypothetical protein
MKVGVDVLEENTERKLVTCPVTVEESQINNLRYHS